MMACQLMGPPSLDRSELGIPAHFPDPPIPADERITAEKRELGRRLFYDFRLAVNGSRACGICHEQPKGWTDGFVRSVGALGDEHTRNSLSLINVVYREQLTWQDPSMVELGEQMIVPLMGDDPVEMGMSEALILERLWDDDRYPELFESAFPRADEPVSLEHTIAAINAFQRTIIGGDTPWDRYLQGDSAAMTDAEQRGMSLFFSARLKCSRCHGGLFLDSPTDEEGRILGRHRYANTGLYDIDGAGSYPEDEQGLFALTGEPEDMGVFRVPSLRNVSRTKPWGHDGTFLFLEDVVDAYARGGRHITSGAFQGDGAQNPYKDPLVTGFALSQLERDDLLAFLNDALTDDTLLEDPSLATPFCIDDEDGNPVNSPCEPRFELE